MYIVQLELDSGKPPCSWLLTANRFDIDFNPCVIVDCFVVVMEVHNNNKDAATELDLEDIFIAWQGGGPTKLLNSGSSCPMPASWPECHH